MRFRYPGPNISSAANRLCFAQPGIKKALKKVRGSYIPPTVFSPPMFAGRGIELFDIVVHMHGLGTFEEESNHTIKVALGRTKVLVLKLERIIASKKATGRAKDKLVLQALSDALKTIREAGTE